VFIIIYLYFSTTTTQDNNERATSLNYYCISVQRISFTAITTIFSCQKTFNSHLQSTASNICDYNFIGVEILKVNLQIIIVNINF